MPVTDDHWKRGITGGVISAETDQSQAFGKTLRAVISRPKHVARANSVHPEGAEQSHETRGKRVSGENVVSPVVSSGDLERAIQILEAAGLDNVADLLREYNSRIVK